MGRGLGLIGRTALSCYVLQNLIASAAFHGWGLELKGRVGAPVTLLV